MKTPDGLILFLPETADGEPRWMRIVDGSLVQSGSGVNWVAACGLRSLLAGTRVMLVPPAALVALHWIAHPDLPVRQGRAAARLEAVAGGIAPSDQLFAATEGNDDPARPHIVAVAARGDMQQWLLWAQHHGLDVDSIVPAPLLLPEPEQGFVRGVVGGTAVLRGTDIAFAADMALPELMGDAPVADVASGVIEGRAIAALDAPPLDMRQGDFARRVRRRLDTRLIGRIALWCGLILLCALLIALIGIMKNYREASRLDADSIAVAQQALPGAADAVQALSEMQRQLVARGAGARAFTASAAVLMRAVQDTPGVAIASLSRDADGTLRARLAATRVEDINSVLGALQTAGFTITATPSREPGGQMLADITVQS